MWLLPIRILVGLLVLATLLPLLPVGSWIVRLFDFPRLQIACFGGLLLFILAGLQRSESSPASLPWLMLLTITAVTWQLSHVAHYSQLWPKELPDAEAAQETVVRLAVVNLQYENDRKQEVRQQLADLDVDLLLLIELDEEWADALADLRSSYAHSEGVIRGEGLGLMLWSKLPLENASTRYLVSERRPSIHCTVVIEDAKSIEGESAQPRRLRFVGVHPTPPGLSKPSADGRQDSRIRDAELMLIAHEVASQPDETWVVSGDFNDVAWSHTTRLFKRISGLRDPRVGRGLYNTYHAQWPVLRFPIDHVFLPAGARIHKLGRFHPSGSDHFAITTDFSFAPPAANAGPDPVGDDLDDAHQLIREGIDDAVSQRVEEPLPRDA